MDRCQYCNKEKIDNVFFGFLVCTQCYQLLDKNYMKRVKSQFKIKGD